VREGRAALGTGLKEFASRGVPWIIEAAGFDYCMIGHKHGAFDLETIADLAGWFQATDVSATVRIHKSFMHLIPAILDQGIMGIQVSRGRVVISDTARTAA
jgi:2-keto-3-deoxy-L-rhamnonate aldolase RhmA